MKKPYRLLSLLLALFIAASLLCLPGCTKKAGTPEQTVPSAPEETVPGTEESAPPTELDLIREGQTVIRVIRAENAEASSPEVRAAMQVQRLFAENSDNGGKVLTTDWTKDGNHDASTCEILVGSTDYPESRQVLRELAYGDYAVRVCGNKLVIAAHTAAAFQTAADMLCDLLRSSLTKEESGKSRLTASVSSLTMSGTTSRDVSAIPLYTGGGTAEYYDSGSGCHEIIISGTDDKEYAAYLDRLASLGYTCYTNHEMNGNPFATYYSQQYTVNVGYYAFENKVRIISEPYTADTLIGLAEDNRYEAITTSKITMLGMAHYDSTNTFKGNGLGIVIRLTDGRFVVVDGGFHWDNHINQMIATLKEQSKDYSDKTGITVAAWIITHAHGDHNGLFKSKYTSFKSNKIKIEKFLVNNLSVAELEESYANYGANFSETQSERNAQQWVTDAAKALGAKVIQAHVGQVYHIANLQMEMLFTIESLAPAVANALNATSIVTKMTFTDEKTGQKTVYMSTGDATGAALLICSKMFGDYLKSDIVQVAHHGGTPWGNENGTVAAYKNMAPAVVLYPAGDTTYEKNRVETRNATLLNTKTNPNFKEVHVASWDGSVTSLELPYVLGSASVSLKPAPQK